MIDQQIVKFLIDWINENTTYSGPLLNLEIIDLTLKELQLKACRGNVQWAFFHQT